MDKKLTSCLAMSIILFVVFSCDDMEREFVPVPATTPVTIEVPANFPPLRVPNDNPTTKEGIALGRTLYYDPRLHVDEEMSCASCHVQESLFTSPTLMGTSAVLPHFNIAWDNIFLWHGDVEGSLEEVMLFEVKKFFQADEKNFEDDIAYRHLFERAFGEESITHENMAKALAQFVRTIISGNSRYDKLIRNEVNFTQEELNGYNLFFSEEGDCFHCHATILFKDNDYHNNGLNSSFDRANMGRFLITGDSADIGRYKTPTLRNIALTAPYMHDNRFSTLKEVLDFYSENVQFTPHTDPLMNHVGGISLTEQEKLDIIAFLNTLTDTAFVHDSGLSNPAQE